MRSPTRTDAYCCERCFGASGIGLRNRMIACPRCGNKRCPKAIDHDYQCTGSNEPGQVGVKAMSNMDAHGILSAAAEAIDDRAAERDICQERSMALAVAIFQAWTGIDDMTEEMGWRFMIALKMARAEQGRFQLDDWVDMAGYVGLAGECAAKGAELPVRASTPHDRFGFVGQEPSEQIMRSYGGTCDE